MNKPRTTRDRVKNEVWNDMQRVVLRRASEGIWHSVFFSIWEPAARGVQDVWDHVYDSLEEAISLEIEDE